MYDWLRHWEKSIAMGYERIRARLSLSIPGMFMSLSRPSHLYKLVLQANRFVDVGERRIVMATRNYKRGKPRFIITLPISRNDFWQYLWERRIPVKVFIEIPSEALSDEAATGQTNPQ
jgi:hypothetical protein